MTAEFTMSHIVDQLFERGFVHVPGFLDPEETEALAQDYRQGQFHRTVYTLGHATPEAIELIGDKIRALLTQFEDVPQFKPSRFGGGAYFATEKGINFGWHQDHESYFINQTHQHYLNIYIPVIKPEREHTNLCVIPIDRFKERSPDAWSVLEWGGAATAKTEGGQTTISNDHAGGLHAELDFELEELCETPELVAGDALLLRGDMFHRTQDNDTERVALSVRAFNPDITVVKEHYEQNCPAKRWFQANNPMYGAITEAFAERDIMILSELMMSMFNARRAREQAAQNQQHAPQKNSLPQDNLPQNKEK
ncbi:MAG: hypothetical protein CMQ05_14620 [Gammaproteobacteria bacterium]|nr:hypothetical protein [Gammaproteobacteria bacterium]RPG25450.1 MAG: hypothetical protein CBC10_007460 [Gammaproteobacteria bacterium TMED50]|tara:strand:+ start:4166 stop:5092 length:927 start_codon:yes stop_codon:yes gene_type:complete